MFNKKILTNTVDLKPKEITLELNTMNAAYGTNNLSVVIDTINDSYEVALTQYQKVTTFPILPTDNIAVFASSLGYGSSVYIYYDDILYYSYTNPSRTNPTILNDYKLTNFENVSYIRIELQAGCCVPWWSEIRYWDNTTKYAKEVKVGDILLGYNVNKSTYEMVSVLGIITKYRYDIVEVTLEDNSKFELTIDHPVLTDIGWCCYDPSKSHYLKYDDITELLPLTTDVKVLSIVGYKQIKNIKVNHYKEPIETYTFNTTNGIDTFVSDNVVLHNALDPC